MALVKLTLKTAVIKALDNMQGKKYEEAKDAYAAAIATAIDDYIKSMTITVSGIATAGSASAQAQVAPVVAVIT